MNQVLKANLNGLKKVFSLYKNNLKFWITISDLQDLCMKQSELLQQGQH